MVLGVVSAWPVVGSIAGGVGAVALAAAIHRYRGRPGVAWFIAVFAAQATWCFAYGLGLLVTDPVVRAGLEGLTWAGIIWSGIAFLGFALEYTGRGDVLYGRLFGGVAAFGLLSTAAVATNAVHGAVWSDLRVEMLVGVATVSHTFGPWAYVIVAVETVLVASAVFLLVDTLLSYGPLYRRETAAVALSAVPPGVALVAWTLEVGPVPQLQLAPVMFVPHVLLDAYAFNRAEMFDRYPTTSRAADRTAIDDLSDPIIALALDRRVVRLNAAAESLLAVTGEAARDRPLEAFLDVPIDTESSGDEVSLSVGARERTYAVSTSPLTDPNGIHVGYTVVLSDITERERRRQQLSVLNRILRHNLRNDAGLVAGYGEVLVDRLTDPELEQMADAIERRAGALAALGEKASTVERLLTDSAPTTVAVDEVVAAAVASARTTAPEATVELATTVARPEASLRSDALQAIVENTVENALEHHDGAGVEQANGGPWVSVTLRREATDGSNNDDNSGGKTDSGAASSAGAQPVGVGRGQTTAEDERKAKVKARAGAGDGAGANPETRSESDTESQATLGAEADHDEQFVLIVEDDGPGIPEHEISAVDTGEETALEHGSGLGLWVIEWSADALGADVDYAHREPRGTRVTVRIPTPD